MSLTTSTNGANTTVTLTRTAPNAKIKAVLTDAAHNVWKDSGTLTWDVASDTQKLAQLENYIVNRILDLARDYNINSDIVSARSIAEAENRANYDI